MTRARPVLFIALVLILIVGLPSRSLGQEAGFQLASWDVEVWPEYDKPSVLVIYNGTFEEGTTFPKTCLLYTSPSPRD